MVPQKSLLGVLNRACGERRGSAFRNVFASNTVISLACTYEQGLLFSRYFQRTLLALAPATTVQLC